ncbi:hypothetical protein GCM10027186_40860 [Micromonospora schwarzwaldensis]
MERGELTESVHRGMRKMVAPLDDGDRRALRALGLTPSHSDLLRLLDGPGAEGATITRLAERLLCTRKHATRLVRRLPDHGLAGNRSDADDQRPARVHPASADSAQPAAALDELSRRLSARLAS